LSQTRAPALYTNALRKAAVVRKAEITEAPAPEPEPQVVEAVDADPGPEVLAPRKTRSGKAESEEDDAA
jgi:hypothetical protein